MTVFTVPPTGGPAGAPGPPGASTPAQQYGGIAKTGDITTVNPTQALAVGFQKLLNFNANMPSSGVTPTFATSNLTIGTTGVYFVFIYMSWAYAPAGAMRVLLGVNGGLNLNVVSGDKTFVFTPSGTSAQNFVSLTAGDVLDIRVAPPSAATLTLQSAQLYVERANP